MMTIIAYINSNCHASMIGNPILVGLAFWYWNGPLEVYMSFDLVLKAYIALDHGLAPIRHQAII